MVVTRRSFIKFVGAGAALSSFNLTYGNLNHKKGLSIGKPLLATAQDDFVLSEGFTYDLLLSYGDKINLKGDYFGYNNDYTAFIPLGPKEGLLWVNHESFHHLFVSNYISGIKTKTQIDKERYSVGGSIVHLALDKNGKWNPILKSPYNRRITAETEMDLISDRPIAGTKVAVGTLANCAGGITPWGTILTCEENYQNFYGERDRKTGKITAGKYQWERFYDFSPEHYGWVVEVNPMTGRCKKLTSLGRFSHEGATVTKAKNGKIVVYSGDDKNDECLYKFISHSETSLESGELFVANIEKGEWISLDIEKSPVLKRTFKDQTDVLLYAREAAHLVGGTPLDRPEDIDIHPVTKQVFLALTNNKPKGNNYGSILKIEEKNGDAGALNFKAATFLLGGEKSGVACPDNLTFDRNGNLWMTTDFGSESEEYKSFGNNGLFFIPMIGKDAGKAFQVASSPNNAELTGPFFAPDNKTLFLSVQGVGSATKSLNNPTSTWPKSKNRPTPSVLQISGPELSRLLEKF